MPYYRTSDFHEQLTLYQQTVAYIENVMLENRDCRFVLLLDMNCNLYDPSHPYSKLLIDMMERFSLKSAFDLIPSFDPRERRPKRIGVQKRWKTLRFFSAPEVAYDFGKKIEMSQS